MSFPLYYMAGIYGIPNGEKPALFNDVKINILQEMA